MKGILLGTLEANCHSWHQGVNRLPSVKHDEWIARYFEVLAYGFAAQPPYSPESVSKQRERC